MIEHTPGPWHFDHGWIRDAATRPIACIDPIRPEYKANARLIEAAPELLEALKELYLLRGYDCDVEDAASLRARAAIAKAEGRS